MNQLAQQDTDPVVEVINPGASAGVVLICEHASPFIPAEFGNLGLAGAALNSHVAWDPGAMAVARRLAQALDAVLVASRVSRLVYDCNRPPEAPDAMPAKSEVFEIPGNNSLTPQDRAARVRRYYLPFRTSVAHAIAARPDAVVITIHSFTPVYHGTFRSVEIGILHDDDSRLADAMIASATDHMTYLVRRNDPYGPQDGVTHTLREHALPGGLHNVMIEIRNDLLQTETEQADMARQLCGWITAAMAALPEVAQCRA